MPGIPGLSIYPVENPMIGISSTEIRQKTRDGLSIRGLVPDGVRGYIEKEGLYR